MYHVSESEVIFRIRGNVQRRDLHKWSSNAKDIALTLLYRMVFFLSWLKKRGDTMLFMLYGFTRLAQVFGKTRRWTKNRVTVPNERISVLLAWCIIIKLLFRIYNILLTSHNFCHYSSTVIKHATTKWLINFHILELKKYFTLNIYSYWLFILIDKPFVDQRIIISIIYSIYSTCQPTSLQNFN